jgi:hypothetical protein
VHAVEATAQSTADAVDTANAEMLLAPVADTVGGMPPRAPAAPPIAHLLAPPAPCIPPVLSEWSPWSSCCTKVWTGGGGTCNLTCGCQPYACYQSRTRTPLQAVDTNTTFCTVTYKESRSCATARCVVRPSSYNNIPANATAADATAANATAANAPTTSESLP